MSSWSTLDRLDWSGKGSHHVDYTADESIPLQQEEHLGHGSSGSVYKTVCEGIPLAWKTKYCRKTIGAQELKEIWNLRKLNHHHIVKLVGSYTYRQNLGLLIYPVAVCTLATFFDDLDIFKAAKTNEEIKTRNPEPIHRFRQLGIDTTSCLIAQDSARQWLLQCFGCLAGALAYLHSENIKIKHKDLKPSNFLLTSAGAWIADFGTSKDFSDSTGSESDNGERGTARYFAPEVANWGGTGRAADIFSLGCVFLEMFCSCTLAETLSHIFPFFLLIKDPKGAHFQANIDHIHSRLFPSLVSYVRGRVQQHLLLEIKHMLSVDPKARPTAAVLKTNLGLVDGFRKRNTDDWGEWPIHGKCCLPVQAKRRPLYEGEQQIEDLKKQVEYLRKRLYERDRQVSPPPTTGSRTERNTRCVPMTRTPNPRMSHTFPTGWSDSTSQSPLIPDDFNGPTSSDEALEPHQQHDEPDSDEDNLQTVEDAAVLQREVDNTEHRPTPHTRTSDSFSIAVNRPTAETRPSTSSVISVPNRLTGTTSAPNQSSPFSRPFALLREPYTGPLSFANVLDNNSNAIYKFPTDHLAQFKAESSYDNNPFRNHRHSGAGSA
ncbi:kinase-like protein [Zopfia rhizophila CBS 207.26]|uniref:non-specific serine/threonine protein kinase n=1 Tax=Zopfia rhizophila CBS 207.26 TaxID=1314779 RepID=A0A6A6EI83_9PEZI|nr:kinase-like protein [Zopfia rhizophila CBS 207.26]